jgi:hypothetical protein
MKAAVRLRQGALGVALATACFGGAYAVAMVPLTIPQGTKMRVTLSTPVRSERSMPGDALAATTTAAIEVDGRVVIPAGSIVRGRLTQVIPGTGMSSSAKGGFVVLTFDKVTTPEGFTETLAASLTSLAGPDGKIAGIVGGSAAGVVGITVSAGIRGKELRIPAGTALVLTLDQPLEMADGT